MVSSLFSNRIRFLVFSSLAVGIIVVLAPSDAAAASTANSEAAAQTVVSQWAATDEEDEKLSLKDLVDRAHKHVASINAKKHKWQAHVHTRFSQMHKKHKRHLLGFKLEGAEKVGIREPPKKQAAAKVGAEELPPIPDSFDSADQWPQCADYIRNIRDQSSCGSCWAVSSASMLTDRLCIARTRTGQQIQPLPFLVSAADILSCSGAGDCTGGWPSKAMQWVEQNRVVSGSNYSETSGCMPYPFPPKSTVESYPTPACSRQCQSSYPTGYETDKAIVGTTGPQAGHFDGKGLEQRIQREIMTNGPVVTAFTFYDDLYYYSSGIYERTSGSQQSGGHAVKIVGWGSAPDAQGVTQPYWLIANSWNTDWGENGFVRFLRGQDECQVESTAIDFVVF